MKTAHQLAQQAKSDAQPQPSSGTKRDETAEAETAIYRAVSPVMGRMLARGLDNSPAADELPYYAEVLAGDMVAEGLGAKDADRIAEALDTLGRHLDKWPTPRAVLDTLKTNRKAYKPFPKERQLEHQISDEEREAQHLRNRELIERLKRYRGPAQKKKRPQIQNLISDEEEQRLLDELDQTQER